MCLIRTRETSTPLPLLVKMFRGQHRQQAAVRCSGFGSRGCRENFNAVSALPWPTSQGCLSVPSFLCIFTTTFDCFLSPNILSCQPQRPFSSSPRQLTCRRVKALSAGQSPEPVTLVLCRCTPTDGTLCLGQGKLHPQVVIQYLMSPSFQHVVLVWDKTQLWEAQG